jgi:hypothetical protein
VKRRAAEAEQAAKDAEKTAEAKVRFHQVFPVGSIKKCHRILSCVREISFYDPYDRAAILPDALDA